MAIDLKETVLPWRAVHYLCEAGFTTLEELTTWSRQDLRCLKGIHDRTIDAIAGVMRSYDLRLRDEPRVGDKVKSLFSNGARRKWLPAVVIAVEDEERPWLAGKVRIRLEDGAEWTVPLCDTRLRTPDNP